MTRARRVGGLLVLVFLVASCAVAPPSRLDPLSAAEHNDLGVAYYARADYVLAAREFSRATALRPDWSKPRANLGDAQLALGYLEAAIDTYQAALEVSERDPAIANNLAWALLQHPARWREAEPVIREALARNPEPRGYYLDTLGVLLLKRREPQAAVATFRAALADSALRDPKARALVLRHTGEALAELGAEEGAARCEGLARELAPPDSVRPAGTKSDTEARFRVGGDDVIC